MPTHWGHLSPACPLADDLHLSTNYPRGHIFGFDGFRDLSDYQDEKELLKAILSEIEEGVNCKSKKSFFPVLAFPTCTLRRILEGTAEKGV